MARYKATGTKKGKSRKASRNAKSRSAVTGRYVVKGGQRNPKTTASESKAGRFAESFIERHPDTFHELSKR